MPRTSLQPESVTMNNKVIFALFFCGLWSAAEPTFIVATTATAGSVAAALGLGALAVLKGALIGALIGRGKRDVSGPEQEQSAQIALDVAQQIDTSGCVAKLLCELEALPKNQLSPSMATLKAVFDKPSNTSSVYDLAVTVGIKLAKNDPKACARLFEKCPLPRHTLFDMLESVFTC